jgi:hypothetical protein
MDFALVLIAIFSTVFIAVRLNRKSKKADISAIEKEVDNDFTLSFEEQSPGVLSTRGMNDLVEWCEDDLRERKLKESKVIESFNELK